MLNNIIWIIVGVASLFIFIILSYSLLFIPKSSKIELGGEKSLIVYSLVDYIYKCFEIGESKRKSIICNYIKFNSSDEISKNDILSKLNPFRIDKERVLVNNLGSNGEIIIRYERGYVYVEKVEHERISS